MKHLAAVLLALSLLCVPLEASACGKGKSMRARKAGRAVVRVVSAPVRLVRGRSCR